MGRSMDETPVSGNKQRWDMYATKWEWDDKGGFRLARFFGDVVMEYIHQMETKNGKFYPEFCHGWDVDNCKFYADREARCPCCAANIKGQHRYFMNVIDIEAEENKPSKIRADWSPIRFMDISPTLFTRLKELKTVNKGVAISDPEHGAVVQVKFNKNTDPGSMYSATMDTKDVALTEEQKQYVVIQKYPDGMAKTVRGKNGLPAQFEYIRCVNSRDDMVKSLRRNGYYGESEQASAAAHSFDDPLLSREEKVAKMDAEAQVEVIDMDSVFSGASTTPVVSPSDNVVTVASEPVVAAPKAAAVAAKPKSNEPSEDCPTAFGEFANTMICFSECLAIDACRAATNKSQLAQPTKQETQPQKKEVAPVDDDDDTV